MVTSHTATGRRVSMTTGGGTFERFGRRCCMDFPCLPKVNSPGDLLDRNLAQCSALLDPGIIRRRFRCSVQIHLAGPGRRQPTQKEPTLHIPGMR